MKQTQSANIINLLGIRQRVLLVRSNENVTSVNIMMIGITAEQEKKLDRSNKDSIYFYGDFDANNKEHVDIIRNYALINKDYSSIIHSNFDYNAGIAKTATQYVGTEVEYVVKQGATIDPLEWFKYNHCMLGKPPKVLVYNSDRRNYAGEFG